MTDLEYNHRMEEEHEMGFSPAVERRLEQVFKKYGLEVYVMLSVKLSDLYDEDPDLTEQYLLRFIQDQLLYMNAPLN